MLYFVLTIGLAIIKFYVDSKQLLYSEVLTSEVKMCNEFEFAGFSVCRNMSQNFGVLLPYSDFQRLPISRY